MATISQREKILDALQLRFREAMKISRGYNFEPKFSSIAIEPEEIILVPDTELPYYLLLPQPEGDLRFMPAMQKKETLVLAILGRVDVQNPTQLGSKKHAWEAVISDIERAIGEQDATLSNPGVGLGGLAVDMRLRRPRALAGLGPDPIVVVEQFLEVPFYGTYGQP